MNPDTTANPAACPPAEPPGLRAWLDQLLEQHATQPAKVAAALAQRASTLPADAEGGEALRLAEHVLLAHLADAAGLLAFVKRLPATLGGTPATAPSLQRLYWALATLAAQPAPPLPDAPPLACAAERGAGDGGHRSLRPSHRAADGRRARRAGAGPE